MRGRALLLLCLFIAGCAGPAPEAPDDAFAGDVEQTIDETVEVENGTGAVAGIVRNVAGARLEGAHVFVYNAPTSAQTDAQGAFFLTDVPPGQQRLRVNRDGYLGLERDITVRDGAVTRVNVTLADNVPGGPGFREHLHDLWRGATQVTLFSGTVAHDHAYPPGGSNLLPCSRGGGITVSSGTCYDIPLVPEAGTVVPPGTAEISFTVDWEPSEFLSTVQLYYQPANETAYRSSPPLEPGDTYMFPVTAPMNDHGHQIVTQWSFLLHAEAKVGSASLSSEHFNERFAGVFTVDLVAYRGGETPAEEPHPRYWAAGDTLDLMEQTKTLAGLPRTRIPTATVCGDTAACFLLPAETVVPAGTTRLQVTLEYSAGTPALESTLTRKTLAFRTAAMHPSDATLENLRVDPPTDIEGGRTYYDLELGEGEADPFYQSRSNWMFLLANEGEERGEQFVEDCYHFIAGCGGTTYTLRVVAINDDWTPELAGIG